jgi:2'-5' RNA ligase
MRLFFALEPPARTTIEIAGWRDRTLPMLGAPVPPQNFHITLAFLGEHREAVLGQLIDYVDNGLRDVAVTGDTINLDRVGFWPKAGIYWLGATEWPESLNILAAKLNHAGLAIGAKRGRNTFQPHITLFRRCQTSPQPGSTPDIQLAYESFSLFESRTGKSGVSYHSLCDWEL